MVDDFEEIFWEKKISDDKNQKYANLVYVKRKFLAYLVAARSPTIFVSTAFLLIGEWYAAESLPIYQTILMIIFLILVQFVFGLANFAFDKKIDIFARKHTVWVFKYISAKEMLITSIICSLIGLFTLWYYFNLKTVIAGTIIIIITFFYSMPPIRFKIKPPVDCISNMLILGSLPFILGWLSTGTNLSSNTFIFGLVMGIPVIVYYLIIGWQDIKTDSEFGIKTTSVLLGYNWTINISIFLWTILIFFSALIFHFDFSTMSFLVVFPVLLILWMRHRKITDYKLRQKSLSFFLSISTLLWLYFIYSSLSFLTMSIIPIVFLIIQIIMLLKDLKSYRKLIRTIF